MPRKPLKFYRLWCGRKRYSGWKPSRREAFIAGIPHGVTYQHADGSIGLGPLTWIETGERKYARSATISLGRRS